MQERLSERDLAILVDLDRLRLLTGKQLRRLHFPDGDPITQARKARATIRRLAELGVIVRLERRVGGMRAGSEGFVIGLSGWGHAVLALDDVRPRRHRRVIETKPAFQSHVLAIGELYVALIEHTRAGSSDLIEFAGEPEAWRQFGGLGGQAVTLKPDGFVRLGVGDIEVLAFLEQDMDTESLPTIDRKLGVYVSYWRSGQEQRHLGVFPKVWWLVPSTKRLEGISRTIAHLPLEARALFAVCLMSEAVAALTQPLTQGGAS
ncbi:replication-relaxation family protein [Umezawaea sp. Da 62-37]|uniref:replication-relaxation family protein n=1 Tax=Umezawaea sp. Da 62-37 TaxID=3075927 RepID=UPI0028F731C4|nr:replication-relaxation family protein [Umezawaea sp. Da 62-37]WNV83468.1 replication-relaxation family protein [Umezawaea sp. Da 62-37]